MNIDLHKHQRRMGPHAQLPDTSARRNARPFWPRGETLRVRVRWENGRGRGERGERKRGRGRRERGGEGGEKEGERGERKRGRGGRERGGEGGEKEGEKVAVLAHSLKIAVGICRNA